MAGVLQKALRFFGVVFFSTGMLCSVGWGQFETFKLDEYGEGLVISSDSKLAAFVTIPADEVARKKQRFGSERFLGLPRELDPEADPGDILDPEEGLQEKPKKDPPGLPEIGEDEYRRFPRTEVVVWDLAKNEVVHRFDTKRESEDIHLAFSPDNKQLAALQCPKEYGEAAYLTVWDVATGKEVWTCFAGRAEHMAWGPDHIYLLRREDLLILEPVTGRALRNVKTRFFASDSDLIYLPKTSALVVMISKDTSANLYFFDLKAEKVTKTLNVDVDDRLGSFSTSASFDEKFMVVAGVFSDSMVAVDITGDAAKEVYRRKQGEFEFRNPIFDFIPGTHTLSFPDTRTKLVALPEGTITDTLSLKCKFLDEAVWTPDGKALITLSDIDGSAIHRLTEPFELNEGNVISPTGYRFRTWKSRDGNFGVVARLAGRVGNRVILEQKDGEKIKVDLDKLSDADVEYLNEK